MTLSSQYNKESANNFLKRKNIRKLSLLIYRDLPLLLNKYLPSEKALDFGCGPGISTRFLAGLGFEVIGVDINQNMVKEALSEPDGIPFAWIEHGKMPFKSESFDLVLSIMVLLEMPDLKTMQEAVNEIARIIKPGGIFLTVVGSENFPKYNWLNEGVAKFPS
jgi:SAM-dependent methyltransferase